MTDIWQDGSDNAAVSENSDSLTDLMAASAAEGSTKDKAKNSAADKSKDKAK